MPSHRVPMTTLGTDQSQFVRGPFQKLHNLAMREPEMVEPLPGRELVASNVATAGNAARRMWPLSEQGSAYEVGLFSGFSLELRAILESGSSAPVIADSSLLGMPCGLTEQRKRPVYAGPRGSLVFDDDMGSARMLGMLQPTFLGVVSSSTTAAQAVPANSRVAWRATLHRKHEDGYEITSAPSYAIFAEFSGGATRDYTIRIGWLNVGADSDQRVREGDVLRLWRARAVTYATSTNDRYLLTAEYTLTSTDESNLSVDIRDVTPDAALASREELYTNPGMQGALAANWQLGPCSDVAVYNEHAWYAERSLPAYIKLAISSRTGLLVGSSAATARGIGIRGITATQTNGNPTLTGVSSMVGIVEGQQSGGTVPGGAFPTGATIIAVDSGLSTITFDTNAPSGGGGIGYYIVDMIEINGTLLRFANIQTLLFDAWDNDVPVIIMPDMPVDGTSCDVSTGAFSATSVDLDGLEIVISMVSPYGTEASELTVCATNGANYSPQLPELASGDTITGQIDERLNRAKFAKLDQPEHVPAASERYVGKGEIVRYVSTDDRLYVFCTDGTYTITGRGDAASVDTFDRNLIISNQAAADTMNGNVYVYAKRRGLLRIEPSGSVTGLSKGAVQRELDALTQALSDNDGDYEMHLACDELHSEITLFVRLPPGGESVDTAEIAHVFNERTTCWSTRTPGVVVAGPSSLEAMCWSPRRDSLVWSQDGATGGTAPDVYRNMVDTNLFEPIPGATLQTYPQVPAGTTGMQRWHEALLTVSYLDDLLASECTFTISSGVEPVGAYAVQVAPLPGNPAAASPEQPAFFQARHMVARAAHVAPALVINVSPGAGNTARWRLHAIDVLWQPESGRSYSR